MQYATREHFLTELALDPPRATGDLAGAPLLDEDYLILSTIHSAKGQEWDAVYLLNLADGNFPSEFATGEPGRIEEERRLLYVAMTRAKRELHLIAPLKYYLPQQTRRGDAHVYGAQSRFMTRAVMARLERSRCGRRREAAERRCRRRTHRGSTSPRGCAACGRAERRRNGLAAARYWAAVDPG